MWDESDSPKTGLGFSLKKKFASVPYGYKKIYESFPGHFSIAVFTVSTVSLALKYNYHLHL